MSVLESSHDFGQAKEKDALDDEIAHPVVLASKLLGQIIGRDGLGAVREEGDDERFRSRGRIKVDEHVLVLLLEASNLLRVDSTSSSLEALQNGVGGGVVGGFGCGLAVEEERELVVDVEKHLASHGKHVESDDRTSFSRVLSTVAEDAVVDPSTPELGVACRRESQCEGQDTACAFSVPPKGKTHL